MLLLTLLRINKKEQRFPTEEGKSKALILQRSKGSGEI